MTQVLRTAVLPSQLSATCTGCDVAAFIQGTADSVQFYANLQQRPTRGAGRAEGDLQASTHVGPTGC